ncbi:MAG: carbohydrate ABC transporter permease [Trueperaceae bacterium]|nr:MAG: carbohydrate ABC transporter permease [Trueperaceae bacterium]
MNQTLDKTRPAPRPRPRLLKRSLGWYIAFALCVLLAIGLLIPLYWMIIGSLKVQRIAIAYPPQWIPLTPTLENWQNLFGDKPSFRWMFNSFVVASCIGLGAVTTSVMAGYAFSKKVFPGREILFWAFLLTMMVPRQAFMIPMFILMRNLKWFDTYQAMIVPFLAYPFGIFLMRQYMRSIPDELLQAATVDGASELQLFWHVVVPLSRPAIGAVSIFAFMAGWNDYLWQLVVTNSEKMMTLPVGVSKLAASGVGTTDLGLSMAGATFAFIPMFIIFMVFQNYFIKGITVGSLKG